MNIDSTAAHCIYHLLGTKLVATYEPKFLLTITSETLDYITGDVGTMFEELDTTREDMKEAWRQALTALIYDGTLINILLPNSIHCDAMTLLENGLHAMVNLLD